MALSQRSPSIEHKKNDSYSPTARLFGAGAGTLTAFFINLPSEVVTTRIQIANKKMNHMNSHDFYEMVFKTPYKGLAHMPKHMQSLGNGLTAGAVYKITQGTFRYWYQPVVKNHFQNTASIKSVFHQLFGEKFSQPMMEATAGSIAGVSELIFYPFDTIKKQCMASQERKTFFDMVYILKNDNIRLFKGAKWAAARNFCGSFFQFGGYAFTLSVVFQLEDYREATTTQKITAATIGGILMTALTNPFEVRKVRDQTKTEGKILGLSGYFKGTTIKVLTKGPLPHCLYSFIIFMLSG
jgi:hypothetical protein